MYVCVLIYILSLASIISFEIGKGICLGCPSPAVISVLLNLDRLLKWQEDKQKLEKELRILKWH